MKPENKQRFSIRKYAIGAASVLIGFAFQAQAVEADPLLYLSQQRISLLSKLLENPLHKRVKKSSRLLRQQKM